MNQDYNQLKPYMFTDHWFLLTNPSLPTSMRLS